jgi:hypothetical protein
MRKYEEHASYDIKIELPLCGHCGKIMSRCGHHHGWTLEVGESFESVTPERRAELAARAESWEREQEAFRARILAARESGEL